MCFLHNEWLTPIGQFWKWGLRLRKNQPFFVGVSNGRVNYFYWALGINEPQASQPTILTIN